MIIITGIPLAALIVLLYVVPFGPMISGVAVGVLNPDLKTLASLTSMSLKRLPVNDMVQCIIKAHTGADTKLTLEELKKHHADGGDIHNAVDLMVDAKRSAKKITFAEACRKDLDGVKPEE